MSRLDAAIKLLQLAISLRPPEKSPPPDYSEIRQIYKDYYDGASDLIASMPKFGEGYHAPALIPVATELIEQPTALLTTPEEGYSPVATSCIACSRSHLVTIAGALEEGLRFAREGGIMHPEAVRRIDAAEREVTNLERIDLAPDAILASPPKEQELARYFIPKIRELRQKIGQIASVEQMEQAAAESSLLSQEFRLRQMELAGADLNPIISLAKAVENGEITIEEAREKVKEYLPSEA